MATALTDAGSPTYISFPIEKISETPDGDIEVYGKATDGIVDSDRQIVDPEWAAKAVAQWLETGGNVRVQHNPMRDPAGKGLAVDKDGTGGQWVRSLIVEDAAKNLVRKGVLRSYSVGIMHPQIVHDAQATNGRIVGGEIGEISLVDRPANKNCVFQLVKAAASGEAEWVGKLSGSEMLTKDAPAEESDDVTVKIPGDVHVTFTPSDLAKMLGKRKTDPDVGGGVDRDKISAEDFAGRNRSFPIVTPADVDDAARSIGRAGADNFSSDELKANIIRIAKRKGDAFTAQLPEAWKKELGIGDTADKTVKPDHGFDDEDEVRTAGEDVHDSDSGDDEPDDPDTEDSGSDDEDDEEKSDKSADSDLLKGAFPGAAAPFKKKTPCGSCGKKGKAGRAFCSGCGAKMAKPDLDKDAEKAEKGSKGRTKPTPGEGVVGAHTEPVPAHREPDGAAIEAFEADAKLPTDPDAAMKTAVRHQSIGLPGDLGRLHDLLCPAYSAKALADAHPMASLSGLDAGYWQDHALKSAAGAPLEEALRATDLWHGANLLKSLEPELADELHAELHKAFKDANIGPGRAPTPSSIKPGSFKRPYIAAGHARPSFQQEGPNTAKVPVGQTSAAQFDRGLLTAGHAADSPANKDAGTIAVAPPGSVGKPTRVFYTNAMRDNARQAMVAMHDHIAHTYPDICSLGDEPATPEIPTPQPKPVPDAVGHSNKAAKVSKKEKVQEPVADVPVLKAATSEDVQELLKALTPDLVKAAVAEATAGLTAELAQAREELKKQRKASKALQADLVKMAEMPDPRTAPYRAEAIPSPYAAYKSAGGGTPSDPAAIQARSQLAVMQMLESNYLTATDPVQREAALRALREVRGI